MHFCIRACDVSALAGRNIFRSKRAAVRKLLHNKLLRCEGEGNVHNCKRILSLIRSGTFYRNAVYTNKLSPAVCAAAEQECRELVQRCYPNNPPQLGALYRRYQYLYLKDRGLVVEDTVINKLKELGYSVLRKTKSERTFSKTFTTLSGNHTYTVYGCVDCFEENPDGRKSLIEIKSRKKQRLQYTHEMDQITVYLVISGYPQAHLVEYVNDQVHLSRALSYSEAQEYWQQHVRGPLEASLHYAAEKFIDALP